jgi:hypothetical protein
LEKRLFHLNWPVEKAFTTPTEDLVEFRGRHQNLNKWADELGIDVSTLNKRLKNGWPIEKAFTKRPDIRFSHNKGMAQRRAK